MQLLCCSKLCRVTVGDEERSLACEVLGGEGAASEPAKKRDHSVLAQYLQLELPWMRNVDLPTAHHPASFW